MAGEFIVPTDIPPFSPDAFEAMARKTWQELMLLAEPVITTVAGIKDKVLEQLANIDLGSLLNNPVAEFGIPAIISGLASFYARRINVSFGFGLAGAGTVAIGVATRNNGVIWGGFGLLAGALGGGVAHHWRDYERIRENRNAVDNWREYFDDD